MVTPTRGFLGCCWPYKGRYHHPSVRRVEGLRKGRPNEGVQCRSQCCNTRCLTKLLSSLLLLRSLATWASTVWTLLRLLWPLRRSVHSSSLKPRTAHGAHRNLPLKSRMLRRMRLRRCSRVSCSPLSVLFPVSNLSQLSTTLPRPQKVRQ